MNKVTANKIYDILKEELAEPEICRELFVKEQSKKYPNEQWRLIAGKLGIGSKFINTGISVYVECLRAEDSMSTRELIQKVNERLRNV